jgi:hypothetical protein
MKPALVNGLDFAMLVPLKDVTPCSDARGKVSPCFK